MNLCTFCFFCCCLCPISVSNHCKNCVYMCVCVRECVWTMCVCVYMCTVIVNVITFNPKKAVICQVKSLPESERMLLFPFVHWFRSLPLLVIELIAFPNQPTHPIHTVLSSETLWQLSTWWLWSRSGALHVLDSEPIPHPWGLSVPSLRWSLQALTTEWRILPSALSISRMSGKSTWNGCLD